MAEINKILVRIAHREDLHQTASSDLGLRCLSIPFSQATSVCTFRKSTSLPYFVMFYVISELYCINEYHLFLVMYGAYMGVMYVFYHNFKQQNYLQFPQLQVRLDIIVHGLKFSGLVLNSGF